MKDESTSTHTPSAVARSQFMGERFSSARVRLCLQASCLLIELDQRLCFSAPAFLQRTSPGLLPARETEKTWQQPSGRWASCPEEKIGKRSWKPCRKRDSEGGVGVRIEIPASSQKLRDLGHPLLANRLPINSRWSCFDGYIVKASKAKTEIPAWGPQSDEKHSFVRNAVRWLRGQCVGAR